MQFLSQNLDFRMVLAGVLIRILLGCYKSKFTGCEVRIANCSEHCFNWRVPQNGRDRRIQRVLCEETLSEKNLLTVQRAFAICQILFGFCWSSSNRSQYGARSSRSCCSLE